MPNPPKRLNRIQKGLKCGMVQRQVAGQLDLEGSAADSSFPSMPQDVEYEGSDHAVITQLRQLVGLHCRIHGQCGLHGGLVWIFCLEDAFNIGMLEICESSDMFNNSL